MAAVRPADGPEGGWRLSTAERVAVAIIGGGPAGSATALTLARQGLDRSAVVLLEASHYESTRVGESIPPDTRLLLERLGVLDAFLEAAHDPCHGSFSCWGSDRVGANDFLFNPLGHGWHLDRKRFDAALCEAAGRVATVMRGVRWRGLERRREGFRLTFEVAEGRTKTLLAARVVEATGAHAHVARALGARQEVHDRLVCVTGFFEDHVDGGAGTHTLLESAPDGWWYAARLPGGRAVAAVASDPDIVKFCGLTHEGPWLRALGTTSHVKGHLDPRGFSRGSLIPRPALSARLDRAAGKGWAAVGDAASCFDPITSQGIYKALENGIAAGKAIAASLAGDRSALDLYADAVADHFEEYRALRAHLYELEDRWPRHSFWRRRHAMAKSTSGATVDTTPTDRF